MSDLVHWKVHGPVKTLRTEHANWDLNAQEWEAPRGRTLVSFRPDGWVNSSSFMNPDGSVVQQRWVSSDAGLPVESTSQMDDGPAVRTTLSYDGKGRHLRTVLRDHDGTEKETEAIHYSSDGKTKVRFFGIAGANAFFNIEGTEQGVGAPGATSMITEYDERDRPGKVVFEDANHKTVTVVTLKRDSAGRLLSFETNMGAASRFAGLFEKAPPEERDRMAAVLRQVVGDTSTTTFRYDEQGRLRERVIGRGSLGENRSTYAYGEREDPIEETTENTSREASINNDGDPIYTASKVRRQQNRFEYTYDTHGNWTERIVSYRLETNPDLQRSNIERRVITYYE
jgi:YD repeat-containing protein